MSSEPVIHLGNLGKCYQIYDKPRDRLLQMLARGRKQYYREFWALKEVSFDVMPGEVVGIIGSNGAGKSTLLQLVCGTLAATTGEVAVRGRVAALLELGAGFNPEFSGRENVVLSAAVTGLSQEEIAARFEDIVDFSGIRDFIDQPVKTYSSGMYVRLAFSIAINVDPDILVIDEALSVGDGEFSRRSFDRIMALKNAGKTILFCSHALYQVEALCNRAVWLANGRLRMIGDPADVVVAYNAELSRNQQEQGAAVSVTEKAAAEPRLPSPAMVAHLTATKMRSTGGEGTGQEIKAMSRTDDVAIDVFFVSDPALPPPSIGIVLTDVAGRNICSAGTHIDHISVARSAQGDGHATVTFPRIPLLKGEYWAHIFLLCERGVHIYDHAGPVHQLIVHQDDLEQGVVSLPHRWHSAASPP